MDGAENWGDVAERLKGQTVTYFDFETTGIADYDGQNIFNDPIQLGAVQVKDGKIVKRFNVYMNPESKLSEWSGNNLKRDVVDENGDRVLDENGKPASTLVTPEWLTEQQSQEQALQDFIDFIGPNALLGGQNVPFDVEILKRMAERSGVQLDIAGTIDSKDLASLLPKYNPETGVDGPKAPDRKTGEIKATSSLGPVANFLGFEPANWHSADGDAEDSYNLVSKIIDRAAAEDSKDLSLLDFPAMQKRYEERMAEFKQVVSPENPMTESQQKALETLAQSNNPAVSQKAAEGLATATTRGEAAKVLFEANELEDLGSQAPSNISAESDPDFADATPKTPVKYDTNAEESDSDFDDADFDDTEFFVEQASPVSDGSSASEAIVGPLMEDYALTLAGLDRTGSTGLGLLWIMRPAGGLDSLGRALDNDPSPDNKKAYMLALQNVVDIRATLMHLANHYSFLGRDPVADSKLISDPRLTAAEVLLINSRISLIDPKSGKKMQKLPPLNEKQKETRRLVKTQSLSQYRESLKKLDSNMKRPAGLPDNWSLYGHAEKFDADLGTVSVVKSTGLTEEVKSLLKVAKIHSVIAEAEAFAKPGYVMFKDSSGFYPGILRLSNTGTGIKEDELAAMVDGIVEFGNRVDYAGGSQAKPEHYNMLITTGNNDNPERIRDSFIYGTTESNVLAYANAVLGTTFFIDRLRVEQNKFNLGLITQKDDPEHDHWASEIRRGTKDVFKHVVLHEFGHAADASSGRTSNKNMAGRPAASTYGADSPAENFAEYMARYTNGQSVPEWFVELLRSEGLLKSQQNNNP
jgi:DNA polymerase III epsilon subunit-like protein